MRKQIITLLCFASSVSPVFAQQTAPPDYKQLYEQSKEDTRLIKERLERALLENKALKSELALLKKRPVKEAPPVAVGSVPPANPTAAVPKAKPGKPTVTEAKLKLNEFVNLESIGGPNVDIEIKTFKYGTAYLHIGTEAGFKKVEIRGDKTLLYRDDATGDEVHLANKMVIADEVSLIFVKQPRPQ